MTLDQLTVKRRQLLLFGVEAAPVPVDPLNCTFQPCRDEPVHRWYPYLEGYAPSFVNQIQKQYMPSARRVLDPFAGTGTTPLALAVQGLITGYCEANPVMQRVTAIKLDLATQTARRRAELASKLHEVSVGLRKQLTKLPPAVDLSKTYPACFGDSVFFDPPVYDLVLRLRSLNDSLQAEDTQLADLFALAIASKLVLCSRLKRAGDVRYKTQRELAKVPSLLEVIEEQLRLMAEDCLQFPPIEGSATLLCADAKALTTVTPFEVDGVITSPPYLNGTNYIRNTKVELWYLREMQTGADLRRLRDLVITSGINDVTVDSGNDTVTPSVAAVVAQLEVAAYDQRIPRMVAAYFADMRLVLEGLVHHARPNAIFCIDIGDSRYGGINVPTHEILLDVGRSVGLEPKDSVRLRSRLSKDRTPLGQYLLVFRNTRKQRVNGVRSGDGRMKRWEQFKRDLPHQRHPFTKRNWGHPLHSLCSYQGKMKPSLAHHLVLAVSDPGDRVLDPFAGAGTIPFEAALEERHAFGMDISHMAYAVTLAKLRRPSMELLLQRLNALRDWIDAKPPTDAEVASAARIRFNGPLPEYFHPQTLAEILSARTFFQAHRDGTVEYAMLLSSMLHILHGNRPYALSRQSHPITPFAPTGPTVYKSVVQKLRDKAVRSTSEEMPLGFIEGQCFQADILEPWPQPVRDLDAIITSPPFFDSTRFYMTNWMRYWFCGWDLEDFAKEPARFVESAQKRSLTVYDTIFAQARERLKSGGLFLLHLGHSRKCNMAAELSKIATKHFDIADTFSEDVGHCESHGVRDKGTVTAHQYLLLRKR